MTLLIHLLGPPRLSQEDTTIELPGYRPLALLAYLLVTGKAHSRQQLVDLLFDNTDDPRASLRWTLSKLRQAIGSDYILADRQEVAFNFESDYWLDVTAFEKGQLDLYRGDFLEELRLREAYRFEDWAFFERERLRASYQAALEQKLAEAEGRGDDPALVETAHQLLRMDNLREDWYRALMGAYARLGQREAALTQFERCRQVLQAELGVEPIAETTALAEAIRQGQFQMARLAPDSQHQLIAGRFTIDDSAKDLLGQGGMGAVYRGRDTQSGEAVAIKLIKPELVANRPDLLQRFIREGDVLRRLNHPHIVKMLAATEQAGRHYLVMEYVAGGSLRDLLQREGRLPIKQVLEIALDLADALTRAHRLNIIHRDLKPENVLLATDGTPRIADFGIARINDSPPLTESGLVIGTLDYLSPEACQGESLAAQADIWAFGVMLYELLTGQRPFSRETLAATLTAILTQPVPNLSQQRPETPTALAELIYQMLEKEPQQRLATVRLVGTELEAILKGGGAEAQRGRTNLSPISRLRPRFSTSLVGRTAEMAVLSQGWQKARAGAGQILLIEGEPGIGKTRLIEELLVEAGAEALVLRAKCPELQEPLAYTLFVDPLRDALAGERPPGLSDTWLAEISRLLPELRDRYPHLPDPSSLEPAAERRRLFDAVCTTLLAWTGQQPLVFFVDDLQWADPTSLALLHHLSRQIMAAPVLLIGAYRLHEVGPQHPLQELRRDWTRASVLTSLALQPLSNLAVNDLLQELTTWGGANSSFGTLIYRETGGNPLFVVETVASLREEGRLPQDPTDWKRDFRAEQITIPTQVQTLIQGRLNRLDDLSRQIITGAAVMRSSFEAEMIQEVSGRSEWETLEGLERLLVGGLLVEQGTDRFTFSHDKIREVAYNSLSQLRRKLLHRRVAEILERQHRGRENPPAGRLAYHYERAGLQEKALDYYLQAGQIDQEQYAHEAAISHYQKALALLKEQGEHERAAQLLMKLGLLHHNIFDFEQARRAYEEGFALSQRAGKAEPATLSPSVSHALRLCIEALPTIDPIRSADTFSCAIIEQLFSGLVETNAEMDVVPDVAQSWEVLEGGRKYIFHLRDDVRWSDGRPVTAEDFEYAWKRVLHPATGSPNATLLYDLKGARTFHQGEEADSNRVGVYALDSVTLEVELEEPTGYLLYLVAMPATRPVPRPVVEVRGETWTAVETIVTNGPFRLEQWQQDKSVVLTRNPTYHGRFTGNVERVELIIDKDWPTLSVRYESNSLDILPLSDLVYFQITEIEAIHQRHAAEYISVPALFTTFVGFDMSQKPFDDLRVRQAFVLAIDRERWAHELERGYVSPATGGLVPPGMPGHTAGIGLPYDPGQARRLLAEAGYPGGEGFPSIEMVFANDPRSAFAAKQLQAQWWENLGVVINYEKMEFAVFLNRMEGELPPLLLQGWAANYPDPDNFLRVGVLQDQRNWRNESYHQLIEEARHLTDQGERLKLYRQADKILIEEATILPLTYERTHLLIKPWVKKYPTSPIQTWFWKDVIIESPAQAAQQPHENFTQQQRASRRQAAVSQPPAQHALRTMEGEPHLVDPALAEDGYSINIAVQLFSGLVAESRDVEVVPDVARSWEILEEGRKYIFHLRDDVRWNDGRPVTAADFEYAWKRVLHPATGSEMANLLYDLKGARAFHQGEIDQPDSVGVSALNPHILAVELEGPTGYFLHLLTQPVTFPVPYHVVEAHSEAWTAVEHIVSNGPFRLTAWKHGETMTLERNVDYHGRFMGNIERVEIVFGLDQATGWAMYEAGHLDLAQLPFLPEDQAWRRHTEECLSIPIPRTFYLNFDMSSPPFNDLRVRQALILATDRGRWADSPLEILGSPAMGGFIPPGMPGHSANIGLPYDLVQARRLLAEAGYPGGRHFPMVNWLVAEGLELLADELQLQWYQNLGIHLNWSTTSWVTLTERIEREQPSLVFAGWIADVPDPDSFLRACLQQNRLRGWQNETYETLIEQARRSTDQRERIKLYQQADRILIEAAALMPVTYGRWDVLVKSWVKQYSYTSTWSPVWKDVIIESHNEAN